MSLTLPTTAQRSHNTQIRTIHLTEGTIYQPATSSRVASPYLNGNKTGLQPVSRPVERILVFFQKVLKRDHFLKVSLLGTHSLGFPEQDEDPKK